MLAALLVAVVATATPAASPAPNPLKTIVTVKSSTFCGQFEKHVNSAISSAVTNDANLGSVVHILKRPDLEGSSLDRYSEITQLTALADSIYRHYRGGETEIATLRALEAQATDPVEKAELKAADDALAGALYRQHLIQRDLDGFVAYLNAADMRTLSDAERSDNIALFGEADPHQAALDFDLKAPVNGTGHPPFTGPYDGLAGDETHEDDARYAQQAAGDFTTRFAPLVGDEMNAATHIEAVSTRC
jgi:hypothetical protein